VIMSAKLFEQTLGLTMENRNSPVGVFANNLKEFDSIRNFFTSGTIASLVDLPFVIIFLSVIFYLAGPIVLVPSMIILLILLYGIFMTNPIRKSIEATYEAQSQKNAVLIETLNAIETIKSLGVEAHSQWKWEQAVGNIAKASIRSKMLQSSIARMTGFMQQMRTIVIVLTGVYLIKDGSLTMGGLIATVMLSQRAIGPMGQFANLTSSYQQTKTALTSLNELMKKERERPLHKKFIRHPVVEGIIEFVDVSFIYPEETKPALSHVSFKLNPGEKLGIIGRIGSGKSTIEKLILGFYAPTEGSILIDGIDIKQLDPAELRRNINYVPQDVMLFKGDIRENIAYRAPYVEDDKILHAAKVAGVDDFVKQHPSGYSMPISEGGKSLSGGQRQSIGVARALLLDTPIFLFDEPTNAMDAKTEQIMINRLKEGMQKHTSIVVTHKMSLLQLVDRLIVLDNAQVIADGPKETVLEALKTGRITK
jgi:ATP-binding cassette subfamily C protein LapB